MSKSKINQKFLGFKNILYILRYFNEYIFSDFFKNPNSFGCLGLGLELGLFGSGFWAWVWVHTHNPKTKTPKNKHQIQTQKKPKRNRLLGCHFLISHLVWAEYNYTLSWYTRSVTNYRTKKLQSLLLHIWRLRFIFWFELKIEYSSFCYQFIVFVLLCYNSISFSIHWKSLSRSSRLLTNDNKQINERREI